MPLKQIAKKVLSVARDLSLVIGVLLSVKLLLSYDTKIEMLDGKIEVVGEKVSRIRADVDKIDNRVFYLYTKERK